METQFVTREELDAFVREYRETLGDIVVVYKQLTAFAAKHEKDLELLEAVAATIQAKQQFLEEDLDA